MTTPPRFSLVKPTTQTPFHIDFTWWKDHDSNWRVYLLSCLCEEHQAAYQNLEGETWIDWIDPETAEVQTLDGLQHILVTHCARQPEFVTNFTTVVDTADTPIPYWCNNTANYADDTTTNYEDLGIVLSSYPSIGGNGYIKNIHDTPDWGFLPSEHQAAAGYFRDYWYPSSSAGWGVLSSGGLWTYGSMYGPFALYGYYSSASTALGASSRLLCF